MSVIDPSFFNLVAQLSHFAWGALFVLTPALLLGAWIIPYAFFICLGLEAVKEFWYDAVYENTATRGSDIEDFIFYALGNCCSVMLLHASPFYLDT